MAVLRSRLEGREGLDRLDGEPHPAPPSWPADPALLSLPRGADDAGEGPALPAAHRPRFRDRDGVADLRGILLVVHHELRGAPLGFAVQPVPHLPLDRHHDALLHLVADDHSDFFRFLSHIVTRGGTGWMGGPGGTPPPAC